MSDSQDKLENGTFLDRLKVERAELGTRVTKLENFIDTLAFTQLSGEDRVDLRLQLTHMRHYLVILIRRIDRISSNN